MSTLTITGPCMEGPLKVRNSFRTTHSWDTQGNARETSASVSVWLLLPHSNQLLHLIQRTITIRQLLFLEHSFHTWLLIFKNNTKDHIISYLFKSSLSLKHKIIIAKSSNSHCWSSGCLRHFFICRVLQLFGFIIMRCHLQQPLTLNLNHLPHVLLCRENQFMIQHPSW